MEPILKTYMEGLKVGKAQAHKNLALYPLLSTYAAGLDYLLLGEALSQGLLEIVEVSKEGVVPELRVINNGPLMVLILDGEELVGAKQNRVVNTTILVKQESTLVIPVSCVEQGRWSYRSTKFATEERIMSSRLRAMKAEQVHQSVRQTGRYRADQGAVWEGIAEMAARRGAGSPSMAMAAIYEKERPSLEGYVGHFRLVENQVGAFFLINGRVAGIEAFGRPDTLGKVFRKLLQSYALDALDGYDPEKETKPLRSKVNRFLAECLAADPEGRPSVGLGTDWRVENGKVTGLGLTHEGALLHFSLFNRGDGSGKVARYSRMARFTERRGPH
jgi:hypothetical protein